MCLIFLSTVSRKMNSNCFLLINRSPSVWYNAWFYMSTWTGYYSTSILEVHMKALRLEVTCELAWVKQVALPSVDLHPSSWKSDSLMSLTIQKVRSSPVWLPGPGHGSDLHWNIAFLQPQAFDFQSGTKVWSVLLGFGGVSVLWTLNIMLSLAVQFKILL